MNQVNATKNTKNYYDQIQKILLLIVDIIVLHIQFWYSIVEGIVRAFMDKKEKSVKGEIVLITGSGHGIGRELAIEYAEEGAKVICLDINETNNMLTVKEIKAKGGEAYGYVCNVQNRSEIISLAEKIKKNIGFVSILINNAGIMPTHPLLQHTETEIRNMYEINVLAHFWMMQAFLPNMIEKNYGHIVALSSCAGLFGVKNLVPYCGTKFAVRGLMQALLEELRLNNPNNNIKLTTIYPYMVDTGLCKKPHYRFPKLMKMVKPRDAARSIIKAQKTGTEEISIPKLYFHLENIGAILPRKTFQIINDFLDAGVLSDL